MTSVPAQLSSDTYVVATLLFYLALNLFALMPGGVMRGQVRWLIEHRVSRDMASASSLGEIVVRNLILFSFILFMGFQIFLNVYPDDLGTLTQGEVEVWHNLALCLSVPVLWVVYQTFCLRWWGYIFDRSAGVDVLVLDFKAINSLMALLFILICAAETTGLMSVENATFLLSLIFITGQIGFILRGILIFFEGIGSLCFIIAYICTLEIAPLAIIYQLIFN